MNSAPSSSRRWLGTLTAVFCTVLVISNVSAIKPLSLPGLPFVLMDGGNLLFPISYIFGDILVEVYGYAQSRRIIWLGFVLNIFAAATFSLVALLPPAPGWDMQDAFAAILLQTPRVVLGSVVAFWCGTSRRDSSMLRMLPVHHELYAWPMISAPRMSSPEVISSFMIRSFGCSS